jgi:murein DD-endopeptidase MepM/ murein hydrolase activator NlpD
MGQSVTAGQKIAASGNTGNTTGPHLHYEERTNPSRYNDKVRRPRFSRGPGTNTTVPVGKVFVSKLQFGQRDSDSVKRLQDVLNGISLSGGRELRVSGDYDELTRDEVKKWQKQVAKGPASILRWQPRPTAGPSDIRTDG